MVSMCGFEGKGEEGFCVYRDGGNASDGDGGDLEVINKGFSLESYAENKGETF